MERIRAFCEARAGWATTTLIRLARLESPTDDKVAVDRCGLVLREILAGLGAHVEVIPQARAGDHIRACFGTGRTRILVLTHFDTVWPVGQLARMPVEQRDGRLYGPGVYDMKGGLVIGLLAMRALFETPSPPDAEVVFLLTSDEETGSATSRALIEREATAASAVFVLEPGLPGGAVKTGRKGVGEFTLLVEGVAAHAGADPGHGASAIAELAHQILALQRLQDPTVGLTVNVGVIAGGTRSNVVAERATAEIDVRITRAEDGPRIDAALRALRPADPRTRLRLSGGINRPPLERTPGVARLFALAREVGAELGWVVTEGSTGGASDGNFTAALGVPTLDGLGALGDGAHALHEHVSIDSLPRRAALLAGLIARLAGVGGG
jgi:glutamate carboxypeptidase